MRVRGSAQLSGAAGLGHERASSNSEVMFDRITRNARSRTRPRVANGRKNRTIVAMSVRDPRSASRLLLTTLLHWKRVAISLTRLIPGLRS